MEIKELEKQYNFAKNNLKELYNYVSYYCSIFFADSEEHEHLKKLSHGDIRNIEDTISTVFGKNIAEIKLNELEIIKQGLYTRLKKIELALVKKILEEKKKRGNMWNEGHILAENDNNQIEKLKRYYGENKDNIENTYNYFSSYYNEFAEEKGGIIDLDETKERIFNLTGKNVEELQIYELSQIKQKLKRKMEKAKTSFEEKYIEDKTK